MVKNQPANEGDVRNAGLIPRSGRSPGGRRGNPPQYSRLENPMDRGSWRATVHGIAKSQTQLKKLCMHIHGLICLKLQKYSPKQEKWKENEILGGEARRWEERGPLHSLQEKVENVHTLLQSKTLRQMILYRYKSSQKHNSVSTCVSEVNINNINCTSEDLANKMRQ